MRRVPITRLRLSLRAKMIGEIGVRARLLSTFAEGCRVSLLIPTKIYLAFQYGYRCCRGLSM